MALLDKFRIPYSDDQVFGLVLLALLLVPTAIAPQLTETALLFSDPLETVKLIVWSALIGLALILTWVRQKQQSRLPKTIFWLLLAFLCWSVVSMVFSYDRTNSLLGVAYRMNSSLWFFTLWASWIFVTSTFNKDQFKVLTKVFLFTNFFIAGLAILQSYGIGFYAGLTLQTRQLLPSFLGNPNFAAMFVGSSFPVLLWFIAKETKPAWRVLYIFFAACSIWSLALFSSRAALLGVAAALALIFLVCLWQRRWKISLAMAGVAVVIAALGLSYLQATRPDVRTIDSSDQSTVERYYILDLAARYLPQHSIVGSGPGNYFIAYRQNTESELADINWFDDPHNLVLFLAVSGGIPLAIIFLLIIALPTWQGLKSVVLNRDLIEPTIWVSAIGAWLVTSSFGPVSIPNWLILGFFIVGLYSSLPEVVWQPSKNLMRTAAAIGVVLILLGVSFTASEVLAWESQLQMHDGHGQFALQLARWSVIANPTDIASVGNWSVVARVNQQYSESERALKLEQKIHPRSAAVLQQVFLGYIELWHQTQDPKYKDEALAVAPVYTASNSNYFVTYRDLATGYLALGENEKSLQAAEHQVVIASHDYSAWVLLAQIAKINGNRAQVVGSIRQAFLLRPSPLVGRSLQTAEHEPDINQISLPFDAQSFNNLVF